MTAGFGQVRDGLEALWNSSRDPADVQPLSAVVALEDPPVVHPLERALDVRRAHREGEQRRQPDVRDPDDAPLPRLDR